MKRKIIEYAKKNVFFRKTVRNIVFIKNKIKYLFYFIFYRVNEKYVFFESYGGRSFACSPKAIYEYLLSDEKYKDYTFIWAFNEPNKYDLNDRTIVIKSKSKKYYKYLSKSKYWITNSLLETGITKKKKQVYVQCWHGTPLKKLRYDIEVEGNPLNTLKEIRKRNDLDTKKIDYFISPSRFATEKFTSAFNLKALNKENIILEKGYPRNDYLYNYKKSDIDNIKKKLNIPKGKKVILYAPTFRDNEHDSKIGYTYKLGLDFDNLKKKLKDDYIILFRAHYFIANKFDFKKYKNFIYDVSNYDDINELYLISDILITDYSSVFFDYANLFKPIIFYMYDLEEYKYKLRDFYIDLNILPGDIITDENELYEAILNVEDSFKKNKLKYKEFNEKFNNLDDGLATKRVVEEVFKNE